MTLDQMIHLNQRVVMFSEGNTGSVPWFHDGYAGAVRETPYDFRKNEADESLIAFRVGTTGLEPVTSTMSTWRSTN